MRPGIRFQLPRQFPEEPVAATQRGQRRNRLKAILFMTRNAAAILLVMQPLTMRASTMILMTILTLLSPKKRKIRRDYGETTQPNAKALKHALTRANPHFSSSPL